MAKDIRYLQQALNNSGLQQANPALFQVIFDILNQPEAGGTTDRLTTEHNEFVLDDNTGLYLRKKNQSGNAEYPFAVSLTGQIYERFRTVALGEWTSYTPTWTSSSSPQPAIGNGTLAAAYTLFGKTCVVRIRFIVGSTTTFGTNVWSFTLPFTGAEAAFNCAGSVYVFDAGTAVLTGSIVKQTTTTFSGVTHNTGNTFTPANPMIWTTGDAFYGILIYEIA